MNPTVINDPYPRVDLTMAKCADLRQVLALGQWCRLFLTNPSLQLAFFFNSFCGALRIGVLGMGFDQHVLVWWCLIWWNSSYYCLFCWLEGSGLKPASPSLRPIFQAPSDHSEIYGDLWRSWSQLFLGGRSYGRERGVVLVQYLVTLQSLSTFPLKFHLLLLAQEH